MKIQWKQVVVSLLTGLLLGAAVGIWAAPSRHHGHFEDGKRHGLMMKGLYRKLDLTSEQRAQVDKILEESRQKIKSLRAESTPRFEEIRKEAHKKIRAILTPEQQKKFEEMEERREKRRMSSRRRR